MNIIVIVSDTFRLDHLPTEVGTGVIAPNLEAFAERSQRFTNCRIGSFPTIPARADIATGKFAFTFMGWDALPADETTMAACVSREDYLTCGVADTPFLVRNGYGYDRGFDDFIWVRGQRAGAEANDVRMGWTGDDDRFAIRTFTEASAWVSRHDTERFFLYVDTWDPHEPWDPPHHYVKKYLPDYDGELVYPAYWDVEEAGVTERELEIAHACYKAEISMLDDAFGKLTSQLESSGIADETAILFTSDHGFYFGEHGIFGKRRFLWDKKHPMNQARIGERGYYYSCPLHQELTRVPFILFHPHHEPADHDCLVSLCDIAPTILELAGAPEESAMHGKSVLPVIRGNTRDHREIVVSADADAQMMKTISKAVDDVPREVLEVCPATIFDGRWELVYAIEGDPHYLFDAENDPSHTNDLAAEEPEIVKRLHASYVDWLEKHGAPQNCIDPRRNL